MKVRTPLEDCSSFDQYIKQSTAHCGDYSGEERRRQGGERRTARKHPHNVESEHYIIQKFADSHRSRNHHSSLRIQAEQYDSLVSLILSSCFDQSNALSIRLRRRLSISVIPHAKAMNKGSLRTKKHWLLFIVFDPMQTV